MNQIPKKYKLHLTKIARRMRLPQDHLDAMLNIGEAECNREQNEMSKIESEFFSLQDDEKFDFVVENSLTNPYLVQLYFLELNKKEDFEAVERLCKKMMELSNDFPMFEFLLGVNYKKMKNSILAKHHMENAVKAMEEASPEFFPPGEQEKMLNDMKKEIKRTS